MAFDDDPSVPPLSVRAAANRLGYTTWAVYKAIDRGDLTPVTKNPVQVSAADVEALRRRKRDEAIERVGLDRMADLAGRVRLQMHPPTLDGGPREHAVLTGLSETVKSAFTMPLLHAAAMPDGSGCRWCAAEVAGRILNIPVRQEMLTGEVGVALLGGPECERHRGLVAVRMAALAARVHPQGVRPSVARTEAAVAAAAAPVVRPRPAQPVQKDDGGRAWIASRLRTERERLKAAKRSGDQRRAIQVRKTIQALEADAAGVDGRPVSSRPGSLRCGHALAANCACPRIASKRATS